MALRALCQCGNSWRSWVGSVKRVYKTQEAAGYCWLFTIWSANPGQQLNTPLGLIRGTELCLWFVPNAAHSAGGNACPRHGWENRFGKPTDTWAKLSMVGTINRDNFHVFFLQVGHPDDTHPPAFPRSA